MPSDIGGTLGPFIRPSIALGDNSKDVNQDLFDQLEHKRRQLEQQIFEFIASKQSAYDEFQSSIMAGTISKTQDLSRNADAQERTGQNIGAVIHEERNGTVHEESVSNEEQYHTSSHHGDRSPKDHESELSGVFTPDFLPLLDSSPEVRRNSTPASVSANPEGNVVFANDPIHDRPASEPVVQDQPARKSALKTKKSSKHTKRVSISIDDDIVRPTDEPKRISAAPIEYDDVASDSPNVAITDRDGSLLYVWVPEDARHPYPEEDAMDYLAAVRGVLHYTDDSHVAGAPLQRFPSDSFLDTSAAINPHEAIPVDPDILDPLEPITGSLDMPAPESFTPPTSPPLQIRQAPSYIDHFGSSSSLIHSPPSSKISPKADDMDWELFGGGGGPSTSYVGGIDGSGVDDIDQGSVGYPSSVGASYMEQFAAQRTAASHSGDVPTNSDSFDFALADDVDEKPLQIVKDARAQIKASENDQFLGEMEF